MKKSLFLILFASLFIACSDDPATENGNPGGGSGTPAQVPVLTTFNYQELVSIRQKLKAGTDANINSAYTKLIQNTTPILAAIPEKVTDGDNYPGGTSHDFWAIGNYSWYNQTTGRWERRDGEINPDAQSDKYDTNRLNTTVSRVNMLAFAWFYSEDEKYAEKATELIRVWFLNEDTKMNPHFEYSCAYGDIREEVGIIYGAQFVKMLDSIQLLTLSKVWTKEDNDKLKAWFAAYIDWLLTSELGQAEGIMTNNHGGWYTAQVAAGAIYNGNTELLRQMVAKGKQQVIDQVTGPEGTTYNGISCPKGSLWRELYRTQSFNYSIYGLRALCAVAGCAEVIGEDLWNVQAPDGRGLKSAFEFLYPFLLYPENWRWEVQTAASTTRFDAIAIIRQAAKKYNKSDFRVTANTLSAAATGSTAYRVAWLEGTNP